MPLLVLDWASGEIKQSRVSSLVAVYQQRCGEDYPGSLMVYLLTAHVIAWVLA